MEGRAVTAPLHVRVKSLGWRRLKDGEYPVFVSESDKITLLAGALGFIGAILGAVVGGFLAGHYSRQATKDLLDEERRNREVEKAENVKALLCALKDEMRSVWNHYMGDMGKQIEALPEGQGCKYYFPIIEEYFPIYHGSVTSLGLIKDDLLRHAIISAHTLAKSLIDSYRLNNQLIDEWEEAHDKIYYTLHTTQAQKVAAKKEQELVEYSPVLKALHVKTKASVEELLETLDTATIDPPSTC
jgi:hypothetical protein